MQHDVGDLMRQHGGDLAGVVGEFEHATGDIDIAAREGEGIDVGGIENGDRILGIGLTISGQQPADDMRQHDLRRPIGIDAAIGGNDPRIFTGAKRRVLRILSGRGVDRRSLPARRTGARRRAEHARVDAARGQQRQRQRQRQPATPSNRRPHAHRDSTTSTWAGDSTSMDGPS